MKKYAFVMFIVLMSLIVGLPSVFGAPAQRWSVEKANDWYDQQPWLVGANYAPGYAINQLEMWQADTFDPETIDRELGYAAGIGMNTMRVFLHDLLWAQDSDAFIERIDMFLDICKKHKIKPMLILFDSVWDPHPELGKQRDPKPHLHNSGWVQGPHIDILKDPKKVDQLEPYVKGILNRFKDDTRILMWDLYNEPGNAGSAYGKHEPENKAELSLALLEKIFAWARQVNPTQPLSSGVWEKEWVGDNATALNTFMLSHSDIITFHGYYGLDRMKERVESIKPLGRPMICTEYMARTADSLFAEQLPYFKENNIGAVNWGLVAGKIQTQYPWESWQKEFNAEPEVWFHDVFRPDGTPYDKAETDLIKKLTSEPKVKTLTPPTANPVVKMTTNKGDIYIELYQDKAPITVANFLKYTNDGFYNGTVFHRVIKGFMIQGGGMTENIQKKRTNAPIKNESYNKIRNARGTIAMARTNAPDSATSQFFINHKDNRSLDFDGPYKPGYAVFGKVVKGLDVVDQIAQIPTKRVGPHANVPVSPVIIESVTVEK